ncbi:MAG: TlyA family RNA methyltransferase [Ruminococcus sp.]|nr:TlyA family RNA methyltransferase [Ruminococcus sp.]
MRLDKLIADMGLAPSREQAKKLIEQGLVTVNGKTVNKPSYDAADDNCVEITGELCRYVGRGGLKLEGALKAFDITPEGLVCADIGASTGGFTDCLLQNGAAYVYAVDVGHGQLDKKLLADERVKNIEGVNARYIEPELFDNKLSLMTCDLSFISLRLVIGRLIPCLEENGRIIALIKPQFEVGKAAIGKNGIVKDKKAHIRMLDELSAYMMQEGLVIKKLTYSPIKGGDGNIEYIALIERSNGSDILPTDMKSVVDEAFSRLK